MDKLVGYVLWGVGVMVAATITEPLFAGLQDALAGSSNGA